MRPVEQRQLYAPPSQRGDCWKCCIASILELDYDEVPHFVQQEEDGKITSYWNATLGFLNARGFTLAHFGLWGDTPFLTFGSAQIEYHFHAPGHWIAGVVSPRTDASGKHISHAVVMRGDAVAYDPHPLREQGHLGYRSAYLLTAT